MDWIKVLNKHILYEYNDLKDSEFAAWIKIMALTAHLEHEPTRKQILSHVNYQTLDSLSKKLHDHSIDLSYILHKVLIDVAYVSHRREALKNNTQRYRDNKKAVIDDVIITSQIREDKIREDKNKTPHTPRKRGDEYEPDFLIFWNAYPKKAKKPTAYREWQKLGSRKPEVASIVSAIAKQKTWRTWIEGYIPDPERWLKSERWTDEEPPNGGNGNGRRFNSQGGFGLRSDIPPPKEWECEDVPDIPEEERKRNLEKIRGFTDALGKGGIHQGN